MTIIAGRFARKKRLDQGKLGCHVYIGLHHVLGVLVHLLAIFEHPHDFADALLGPKLHSWNDRPSNAGFTVAKS